MPGERQTAFELDRGHEVGKDEECGSLDWLAAEDATPAAIAPCPPVPPAQVAADDGGAAPLHPPTPKHRTLVLVAGGIAVFALAAFLATGGSDGAQQPAADTVAASGLVDSVVVPDPMAVRRPASSLSTRSGARRHHRAGKHGGAKDDSDGSGAGSSSGGSGSGGGTGGGGGGGGSNDSAPLATVNLPVVGPVTVEQPDLPPVPDVPAPKLP